MGNFHYSLSPRFAYPLDRPSVKYLLSLYPIHSSLYSGDHSNLRQKNKGDILNFRVVMRGRGEEISSNEDNGLRWDTYTFIVRKTCLK